MNQEQITKNHKFLVKLSPKAQEKLKNDAYFAQAEKNRSLWLDFFSINKLSTPLPDFRKE